MTLFLLDTNAVSDLISNPDGLVSDNVARVGGANVRMSIIVSAELAFGVAQKNSEKLRDRVERLRKRIAVIPFDHPADLHYGALRARLKAEGRPIGSNDLLIAAHALSLEAVLVTDNVREFGRVPGLAVENWLRR